VVASSPYLCVFSDIGGVLGTNGWDGSLRSKTIAQFGCDHAEIDARHRLLFDSYERGFMTLDDYLGKVFFAEDRDFSLRELRDFVLDHSTPWPDNIAFLGRLKQLNSLKLGLISNEGEGLTEFRVQKFGLREVADFMIFSHFVHMRKPDPSIWKLALDLAQVSARDCVYIDDRSLFVEVSAELGFTSIQHTSLDSTREQLAALGLAT
jgi:putative hydrolase of the HAD superfamily